jgi:dienelactone hydrolase
VRLPALTRALLLTALAAAPAAAQHTETVAVPSLTLTNEQFLAGDAAPGVPVTLTGRLYLPCATGNGTCAGDEPPHAVVVLLHGSGGPNAEAPYNWESFLPTLGVATFLLDSFTARGVFDHASDPSQLGTLTRIYDLYRAVDVLAADPRIDPGRIAVMGFSMGGIATLYSAMTRFQRSFGPERGRIAAHIALYPLCNYAFVDELDVADVPIREFHGGADDYAPPGPCRDYIGRLAAAGHDAVMTEYPGVLHQFDGREARRWTDPTAPTTRNCRRVERDGVLVNADTGKPFSFSDACVEYGPSGGYDAAAVAGAQAAVAALLADIFDLPPR